VNDRQRKILFTVKTFFPIGTITGQNFIEGETFAILNATFSTREANYSDGDFSICVLQIMEKKKFTFTRTKNIDVWRLLQITIGNLPNSLSFARQINSEYDIYKNLKT